MQNLSITERKFISYITKYLHGEKLRFLKEAQQTNKHDRVYDFEKFSNALIYYEQKFTSDWNHHVESEELYNLINKLPPKQKFIIVNNLFGGMPLSHCADKLGISKQLAFSYKKSFIDKARKTLVFEKGDIF
ncbi:sigma-70 RNA polymerase sigma factor region 4 domain-containing protein [Paenibacillus kobensis]|uniref:sigma-70 family RNA polymerase sigma factor n=1 Tax=Paenibacillus kobensis TaxID=59841 RepID=UPI000FD6E8C8|nr:sigma-70 family RNA polymerase sigma factor [Paenibacillus kobensis]